MASLAIRRHSIPTKRPAGVAVDLVGTATNWTGSTTFAVSGVAGVSVLTRIVEDGTHARLVVATGATAGTLTVSDGSNSSTVAVRSISAAKRWFPGL